MARLPLLLMALLALPCPVSAEPASLARGLSALVSLGELSAEEAARALPDSSISLPLPAPRSPGRCGILELSQARRAAARAGARFRQDGPPFLGFLDSTRFPIRVYYQTAPLLEVAQAALAEAEEAWQLEIVELGFAAPFTVGDRGEVLAGVRLYLVPQLEYAGLMEPIADVPATPRCDCAVRITLNGTLLPAQQKATIRHELNHASQAATDCAESASAWESFATAVEFVLGGRGDSFILSEIAEFQRFPDYPLDYSALNSTALGVPSDSYDYGAALFPLFLIDRFGNHDLRLLRDLWESFAQDGTMTLAAYGARCSAGNSPDWFEGLQRHLASQGSSLSRAAAEFAAWRAVVGEADDGQHFLAGERLAQPELGKVQRNALPIHGTGEVREYGSRYFELELPSLPARLQVRLAGNLESHWAGSLLLWRLDGSTERLELGGGQAVVESTAGLRRVVLAVSQLQDSSHATDAQDWNNARTFEYWFEDATPPPEGCGCTSSPGGFPALPLSLLASAAFARRPRARIFRRNIPQEGVATALTAVLHFCELAVRIIQRGVVVHNASDQFRTPRRSWPAVSLPDLTAALPAQRCRARISRSHPDRLPTPKE